MANRSKAWQVLIAAAGVNVLIGFLYVWSIISKVLCEEYGWTSAQASLPYTVHSIAFVVAMVIFGRVQDKKGPKLCVVLTGAIAAIGLFVAAVAKTPAMMVLGFGVIAGFGAGISNTCLAAPSLKWFPKEKKGLVSGVVTSGVALASFLYSPLATVLIGKFGVSTALLCFGIMNLVGICSLALVIKNPPADYSPAVAFGLRTTGETVADDAQWTTKMLLKDKRFYLMWLALGLGSSAALMAWGHAAKIAQTQANWNGGMTLVILLATFNFCGRFAIGGISDRLGRVRSLRILLIVQALNMACFAFYHSIPLLIFGVAITGICYGGLFPLFSALITDYGMKNFSSHYSILFTAWGVGGLIGPMSAATVFDATGAYTAAFLIACGLLTVATLIAFGIRERKG